MSEVPTTPEDKELEFRRFQAKLNFSRTIIVSGVVTTIVGLTTAGLNHQISLRELKLEREKSLREFRLSNVSIENAHLDKFVNVALKEEAEPRARFAQYFATLTGDEEARQRWNNYFKIVVSQYDTIDEKVVALREAVKAKGIAKENEAAVQKLKEEVNTLQQEPTIRASNYWVIVGSFRNRDEAQKVVDRIKEESEDMKPFVGLRNASTGFWPVIVGFGTYSEAQKIKEEALKLKSVTGAFLSPA